MHLISTSQTFMSIEEGQGGKEKKGGGGRGEKGRGEKEKGGRKRGSSIMKKKKRLYYGLGTIIGTFSRPCFCLLRNYHLIEATKRCSAHYVIKAITE